MAAALIGPLSWEPPYAVEAAQEMAKSQKKKKKSGDGGDCANSRCQRSKMAVTPRPPGAAEGGAERPLAPTSQMIQTSGDGTAQGLPGEREGEPLRSSIQPGPGGCCGQ